MLLVAGAGAVATGTPSTETAVQETTTLQTTTSQSGIVTVRNFSSPDQIRTGTNYTVTAVLVNRAGEQNIRQVSYRITGNVIAHKNVVIPENGTETIQFNVTESTTSDLPIGTFTHGIFTDDAQATANLTITAADQTATPEETTIGTTTPEETTTLEETTVTETPRTPEANVTFENQTSNGTTVTVESVTVPGGGFVVVHDRRIIDGEVVDSMVGESDFLDAGTHRNVTIQLDEPLNESQRLVAVLYRDSNDNREFDFVSSNRTVDGPYRQPDSREAVNDIAFVTVEAEEE